jgi:xylose isomerase
MNAKRSNRPRYAARLNAFKAGLAPKPTIGGMIARAGEVGGLDAADLNYPDHFEDHDPGAVGKMLRDAGLALNGLAMRYYTHPGFKLGAFTNPDPAVRQEAVAVTKRGIDALSEMGGSLMTLWMGQDGVDYSFQGDYGRMWDDSIASLSEVAAHNPAVDIAIEYKPNEPRSFALMPDIGTTLLAVKEAGAANLGVHLNDGYGKRDDGLMVGTVHPVQTVELFVELDRIGYDGVIYFDTFPDQGGLDPVEEARTNIHIVERLRTVAAGLAGQAALAEAISRQDAAASMRIVADALYGRC